MAVSPSFTEAVRDVLEFVPELRVRRMFGGAGVFCGEMMFGLIDGDELFLKTDDQTKGLFEAEGSRAWSYGRGGEGTPSMGYLSAPDVIWDDPDEARRWAALALDAARRKFKPKKPRRRSIAIDD